MTDVLRVNDTIYSWNSCRFSIADMPYIGILSLDFADALDAPYVWGAKRSGRPLGTVSGKYTPQDVKLVTLRDTADDITTMLTALAVTTALSSSYGKARFPVLLQVSEELPSGVGLPALTVLLDTCRIVGVHETQDEGTEKLVTEFTIKPLSISRNGKTLWALEDDLP
jgi:hypothetical protein